MGRASHFIGFLFLGLLAMTFTATGQESGRVMFEKKCIQSCTPDGKGAEFCKPYCACVAGDIERMMDTGAQPGPADVVRIAPICVGKIGVITFAENCAKGCGADAVCRKRCGCVGTKIKAMGDYAEVGAFITSLGRKDKDAEARMEKLVKACQAVN